MLRLARLQSVAQQLQAVSGVAFGSRRVVGMQYLDLPVEQHHAVVHLVEHQPEQAGAYGCHRCRLGKPHPLIWG